mgnify:FL=1
MSGLAHSVADADVYSAMATAKALLSAELRRQNMSNAELARRMGKFPQEMTKILNPAVYTKLGTLEAAFSALGKRLVVGVE